MIVKALLVWIIVFNMLYLNLIVEQRSPIETVVTMIWVSLKTTLCWYKAFHDLPPLIIITKTNVTMRIRTIIQRKDVSVLTVWTMCGRWHLGQASQSQTITFGQDFTSNKTWFSLRVYKGEQSSFGMCTKVHVCRCLVWHFSFPFTLCNFLVMKYLVD